MRLLLYLVLAAALTAYAFWIYLRVELPVPVARRLAVVRAVVLSLVLLLLFDPRIPRLGADTASARWALLDVSGSMEAAADDGSVPWTRARARAESLEGDGWRVVRFGGPSLEPGLPDAAEVPGGRESRLLPALEAAAEAGAREVRVLSDMRFEDAVALRAAAERLPLDVVFESFGAPTTNAGIAAFDVPDVARPEEPARASVELFGGTPGDSVEVVIFEEEREVARARAPASSAGLRASLEVELPPPAGSGRVRYRAEVQGSDGFAPDDGAVAYANVGFREGGLTLVSFRPDWEPRFLLPVLAEVTGLSATGYLRAGPDRWVVAGRAADRGAPVDSATVRRAASEAALLVVHGLGEDAESWIAPIIAEAGPRLVIPADAAGASAAGLAVERPRAGEWYASPDVPTSAVAGALAGVELQGLPPLDAVMAAAEPNRDPVLQLQLRGAGAPVNAFHLVDGSNGRRVYALASATWRWASREDGRAAYRSLWSGLAGWLLAGRSAAAGEPRPAESVVPTGAPVTWTLPGDSTSRRILVNGPEGVALDTVLTGGGREATNPLPAAEYGYVVTGEAGDTLGRGRFDVVASTLEMLPAPTAPEAVTAGLGGGDPEVRAGRPLRTSPLPYLLLIVLLCGEWVVRRRSGLR